MATAINKEKIGPYPKEIILNRESLLEATGKIMLEAIAKLIKTLTTIMADRIKKFRAWLTDRRNFLFARYTSDKQETQEPEKTLIELPPATREKLINDIAELPSNPADKKAIVSTLDKAFDLWREDPDNANNSVVVLSSPVAAVSRILSETLEEWAKQKQIPINLLPLKIRPAEIETIKSALEKYLKEEGLEDENRLEVAIIPNLSWCFLRSLNGLGGIEYIQSLLCNGSKNRFWIIGGGQVGWQYLNSVCSLEAYCGEVFTLPETSSEDFQDWLEPIVNDLDLTFEDPRIDKQIFDGDKDNKTSYYDRLASISKGVATVAVQLFIKSLKYVEIDSDEDKSESDKSSPPPKSLIAQTPKLPNLPDFESQDRYLLYSLLLHGDMTIAGLAESLGDMDSEVQAQVQLLRREGVVEQKNKIVKINPIYYPRIKQNLASNNFIINRDIN